METFKVENLSFTYPDKQDKTLGNINFTVNQGEFVILCGKSGCGKTTLLRLLKPALAPFGNKEGSIYFEDAPLDSLGSREQTSAIGFVLQNPDNQIVCDKVWHELAFGLESLGCPQSEMRTKVAEMASFFGIESWFYKKVNELSGGQKQLLNLASVMVMQPSVLVLDEPTSQLDPIAAQEFLKTLQKINLELGTTVILSEHRLEEAFPLADRVIVMDEGTIIADCTPKDAGAILKSTNPDMYEALPTPIRVHGAVSGTGESPLTVRDGRLWLEGYSATHGLNRDLTSRTDAYKENDDTAIEIKDTWFRYEKDSPDVIKGLNLKVGKGEFLAIVGGNGTGKTTTLSLVAGLNTPYRGKVLINGKNIAKNGDLCGSVISMLPQDPRCVFVKKTVRSDLEEILSEKRLTKDEIEQRIHAVTSLCRIERLVEGHPYDLSGGEQQRAALAKVLLTEPEILLLDEPTKGMDTSFKKEFARIIADLQSRGVTVVAVSHDMEFCAAYADRCAMFFDGAITACGTPKEFFSGNNFYTTAANRMARGVIENALLAEDIINALR
ncbi:MAG: ATP-binding cassette domain-containing protein [Ruminococcaceae bacterium]|nr:ATP-binding cassette domain-containing protein [Oscillospiraceae bacterium]